MRLNTLLSGAALTVAAGVFVSASFFVNGKHYSPRSGKAELSGEAEEANGAIAYMNKLRRNPITGEMDYQAMAKAKEEVAQNLAAVAFMKKNNGSVQSATLNWKEIGPSNVGGRTRAILIDKNNPNKIYAGGVAGGLWISNDKAATWTKWSGSDQLANMCIASICQASNGDIYFGTGEGDYYLFGTGAGGLIGGGVWKSTDGGNTFNQLTSTIPTPNSTSGPWVAVNSIKTDPNNSNRVYAATNWGLRSSDDGGTTWNFPIKLINGNDNTQNTTDVEVGSDGVVFAAVNSKCYKSLTGNVSSFTNISTGGTNNLPSNASGRLELAISPTDPNYVYATATATQQLSGVYQSVDKGATWKLIGPGGSSQFAPFGANGQADYDNALSVDPSNKGRVILGGVELWSWKQNTATSYGQGQWNQIATEFGFSGIQYYVHSDKHTIVFDNTNPNICYIGCDGGIFRSLDMGNAGPTYAASNHGYNVTQAYGVAFEPNNTSPNGNGVILGTQDNGTQYINGYPNGSNPYWANQINGGDGGEVEISQLNPNAFFSTIYYGTLERSSNKGGSSSSFYSSKINKLYPTLGQIGFGASFVTPIGLYESANSLNSCDSVMWIADQNYAQSTVVGVQSATNNQWFGYTLPQAVNQGDTLTIQDRVVSRIVVGFSGGNGVWMTKKAIDFSASPVWLRIAGSNTAGHQVSGTVESFAWSADGDILYFGTDNGTLYRLKNMASAVDSLSGDIGDNTTANNQCVIQQAMIKSFGGGRYVTGISVDPTNPDNVAVTIANYGQLDFIYYSTNATQASPTFVTKQGTSGTKLPAMPAYGVIIEKSNPKRVIVATEWGIYKTEDITQPVTTIVWTQENANGMANAATFALRQQRLEPWHTVTFGSVTSSVTNSGRIYAGTHGRGVFTCDNYYTPASLTSVKNINIAKAAGLQLFPNPSSGRGTANFYLEKSGDVTLSIYDLNGKIVKTINYNDMVSGIAKADFDASELGAGTYLISVDANGTRSVSRFVIVK